MDTIIIVAIKSKIKPPIIHVFVFIYYLVLIFPKLIMPSRS